MGVSTSLRPHRRRGHAPERPARWTAVIKALKARDLEGPRHRHLRTRTLAPQYVYEQNKPPRLDGYQASTR